MQYPLDNLKQGSVSQFLKDNIQKGSKLLVVSPIFTIYAFDELKESLKSVKSIRFLFNEPTFIRKLQNNQKEVREFKLEMSKREKNVSEFPYEINLKNNLDQNQVAAECYRMIVDKMDVRSVTTSNTVQTSNFLIHEQSPSYLVNGQSLSFSREGLGYYNRPNFTFNMVSSEPEVLSSFNSMMDDIWNNEKLVHDVKETLLSYIVNLYKENSPELVYYLTLYQIFGEKLSSLDDMARIKERTGINKTKIWNMLFNFQHDAVVGAIKKLELYNGCIIADSVGLGKTFEALAIIKYYELRNDRILVLAPKKLRANWVGFKQNSVFNPLVDDRFNYDVLFHTDLSREGGYSGEIDLSKLNWGNYDLVVIDESHNFRNKPNAPTRKTRYQKLMEDIIQSGVKTKVLMLSATPVNNGFRDLRNQIMFITEDRDDAFAENAGIKSIANTLRVAQSKFSEWSKLPREEQKAEDLQKSLDFDFYNLLNTVTIARSRKHIQKYYETTGIGEFPTRLKPISIKTDIDLKQRFPKLSVINNDILRLTLPIYSPLLYVLPIKREEYESEYKQVVQEGKSAFFQSDREKNLVNLMRVNLLKRLESSVSSFAMTLERILSNIDMTLEKLDRVQDLSELLEDMDDEDIDELEIGKTIKVKLKDMDQIKYRDDLEQDKVIIESMLRQARSVQPHDDAKLRRLIEQIEQKILNPINEHNRKVIVFTAFSDTAVYLYEHIEAYFLKTHGIHTGIVTGSSLVKSNIPNMRSGFEEILAYFSPKSSKMNQNIKEIDLLIATDCISEGQNLQDCDYLINYDIHWNPVRIIQRFGRIDRIGSTNKQIQLVNFWPNMELDEYINLENRVRDRMVMVDITATGEDDLLSDESKNLKYRSEQLKQLQNDVVDLEDLSGGISITDLTLDEFLMALDQFMKANPDVLEAYPTGVHAITDIPKIIQEEFEPGVVYCLKQRKFDRDVIANNSLYPFHLVYVKDDGSILYGHDHPKKILDALKLMAVGKKEPIPVLVDQFNRDTKNGNDMHHYSDLLEKAVFDIQGKVEEKGIDSLFKLGKTSLIDKQVSGLSDFELVTFMVIA